MLPSPEEGGSRTKKSASRKEDVIRVRAESAEHITTARAACVSSAQHIEGSRKAIENSLRLLDETGRKVLD
jgi:hypothetical protein